MKLELPRPMEKAGVVFNSRFAFRGFFLEDDGVCFAFEFV